MTGTRQLSYQSFEPKKNMGFGMDCGTRIYRDWNTFFGYKKVVCVWCLGVCGRHTDTENCWLKLLMREIYRILNSSLNFQFESRIFLEK
jgi:hypothetical protein